MTTKKNTRVTIADAKCPFCKGASVQTYKPPANQPGTPGNFRIVADKTCPECQAIWSPPVPRALAIGTVMFGILLMIAVVAWIIAEPVSGLAVTMYSSVIKGLAFLLALGITISGIRSLRSGDNEGIVRSPPNTQSQSG